MEYRAVRLIRTISEETPSGTLWTLDGEKHSCTGEKQKMGGEKVGSDVVTKGSSLRRLTASNAHVSWVGRGATRKERKARRTLVVSLENGFIFSLRITAERGLGSKKRTNGTRR